MASLGDAYIEVHSDTSKVAPEMKAGVKEAADEVEASDFDGLVKAVDKAGTRAGSVGGKNAADSFVRDANGRLRTLDGKFASEGERIGDSLSDGIEKKTKSRIDRLGGLLAPDWIKSIGVWIAALGPAVIELAATVAPAAGLVALLVPAAIGAAASLGILKIAFSGVGKAVKDINGPTATFNADLAKLTASQRAFVMEVKGVQPQLKTFKNLISQNFFTAFSGSVSELGKKLLPGVSKSLGYLSTQLGGAGNKLADFLSSKETIRDLNKIFGVMGTSVGIIGGALPKVLDAILKIGSNAAPYLDRVALDLFNMAQSFDKFIRTSVNTGAFNTFLQNAFTAFGQLEKLGGAVYTIVASIFSAAAKSGGGGALIGSLTTIAGIFKTLSNNGGLASFFSIYNTFFSNLSKLIGPLLGPLATFVRLLGNDFNKDITDLMPGLTSLVNNGLVPLFGSLDNILGALNPVVDAMAKFMSVILKDPTATKIVVDSLIAYFIAVKAAGINAAIVAIAESTWALVGAITAADVALDAAGIGEVILALAALALIVYEVYKAVAKLVDKLGGWGQIWKDIVGGVTAAYSATRNFLEGIGSDITNFFTQTIPNAFNNYVVPFFEALPGVIGRALKQLLSDALYTLGEFIGLFFVVLEKAPGIAQHAFAEVAAFIGTELEKLPLLAVKIIDNIIAFFRAAPGRIGDAIAAIPGIVSRVFSAALKEGREQVSAGITSILNFFRSVPGKLEAFKGALENAGKALVKGFLTGLEFVSSLIPKVGGAIFGAIKNDLNRAIDKINSGINSVAGHFHVGVPNIPRLAMGAYITKPTLALVGERNPEVVLPTDNPGRAMQLLNQSGLAASLNMGTPSVNVGVFIGSQPINDIVDTRIEYSNTQTAKQLSFGTRS
jgi:hypothetical protein